VVDIGGVFVEYSGKPSERYIDMKSFDKKAAQSASQWFETNKHAFVPMPGGQAEPVAGASQMTAGMAAPMGDPAMGGMPPEGMPMDPAMGGMPPEGMPPEAGGMPVDPAAGGMPPEALPPELAALMGGGAEPAPGQISMSVPEFLDLIRVLKGGDAAAPAGEVADPVAGAEKPKPKASLQEVNQKLDALMAALGGGAPAPMPGM